MTGFLGQYEKYREYIEDKLLQFVNKYEQTEDTKLQKTVFKAMKYSLEAGGKRVRPVLCLAVAEMFGKRKEDVLPFAIALEFIHTYSLIHDDLPCMDNDDYRRGKLTNHKVFGEEFAVLAGDGLLNLAFEVMADGLKERVESGDDVSQLSVYSKAMSEVVRCSGSRGMIGGQIIDLESEAAGEISLDTLNRLHELKTGALIRASIMTSAYVSGCSDEQCGLLEKYAYLLGRSFQIKDDVLDFEGTAETLGKTPGKDIAEGKATYVTLYGLDAAKKELDMLLSEMNCLMENLVGNNLEISTNFLKNMAEYVVRREN